MLRSVAACCSVARASPKYHTSYVCCRMCCSVCCSPLQCHKGQPEIPHIIFVLQCVAVRCSVLQIPCLIWKLPASLSSLTKTDLKILGSCWYLKINYFVVPKISPRNFQTFGVKLLEVCLFIGFFFVGCHCGSGGGKLFKSKAINFKMNGNTETVVRSFFAVRCGGVESPYLFTKAY